MNYMYTVAVQKLFTKKNNVSMSIMSTGISINSKCCLDQAGKD